MPNILRKSKAKAALALANNYITLGAEHETDTANPHVVTKAQIGLGNVNNTSDADKPVSTAQQTALDLKADIASPTFTGTVSGITKVMVDLGNVDNTSDLDKPISTAQQTALDLKAPLASPTFTGTVTLATILDASNLPTSDPLVAGQVWNNSSILTVSSG